MTDETKRQKPLYLDMDPDEALRRLIETDPDELPGQKKRHRKKEGGRSPPSRKIGKKGKDRER